MVQLGSSHIFATVPLADYVWIRDDTAMPKPDLKPVLLRKMRAGESVSGRKSKGKRRRADSTSTNATGSGSVPVLSTVMLGEPSVDSRRAKKFKRFVRSVERDPDYSILAYGAGDAGDVLLLEDAKGKVKGYAATSDLQGDRTVDLLYAKKKGAGRGTRLMTRVEELAREQGKDTILLYPLDDAVPFYKKLGYAPEHEDDVLLKKPLGACSRASPRRSPSGCSGGSGTRSKVSLARQSGLRAPTRVSPAAALGRAGRLARSRRRAPGGSARRRRADGPRGRRHGRG